MQKPQDIENAEKSERSEIAESAEHQGPERNENDSDFVYMDLRVDGEKVGRIVIELFKKIVPRTCENFRQLCCGTSAGSTGKPLWYKGSYIHKVFSSFMIQGGDLTNFDGSGGESIYGPLFEDESFEVKLEPGVVGMMNKGEKDTNSSQFFISCVNFPHLQGVNVGFGKVIKGFKIVEEISNLANEDNVPLKKIVIDDCGQLPANPAEWKHWENDGLDQYPPYPEDWDPKEDISSEKWASDVTRAVSDIKNQGNKYFVNKKFSIAMAKYTKALRYLAWIKKVKEDVYNNCTNLSIACLSNLAKTNLCHENFRQALQQCSEVLKMKADAKAYFRRGQANFGLHNYEEALKDLTTAQKMEPNDKLILKEIKHVKNAKTQSKFQERQLFANMLK